MLREHSASLPFPIHGPSLNSPSPLFRFAWFSFPRCPSSVQADRLEPSGCRSYPCQRVCVSGCDRSWAAAKVRTRNRSVTRRARRVEWLGRQNVASSMLKHFCSLENNREAASASIKLGKAEFNGDFRLRSSFQFPAPCESRTTPTLGDCSGLALLQCCDNPPNQTETTE